ncbi:MAG: NAD-dependent protein deacylase [Ignavibacteriales bacterium]|nr:NAD-dependent protein deacylase [Ignavibacteriales bacterium]
MKTIVIFSGAGLSAESGIPTFRDANGLWEQHRVEDVASPDGWLRDPQLVLHFYAERFRKAAEVVPNPAHDALARLEESFNVVNITQNIDTLLERAGSRTVWHLHGRIDYQKCEWHYSIFGEDTPDYECSFRSVITQPIRWGDRCPKCGGQLRPDVVWFGEAVDMRSDEMTELVKKADIFVVVGTSAQVYPAAGLLSFFRETSQKFFVDPRPAREALTGFDVLKGPASEKMPQLVERIMDFQ